jgi:hypothetical protein
MNQITIGLASAGSNGSAGYRESRTISSGPTWRLCYEPTVVREPRPTMPPLPSSLLREHQLRGHVRSGYEHNQDERSGPSQLDQMRIRVFTESVNELC